MLMKIDLEKNMAIKFSFWFFYLKLFIFRLVKTYFGTPQIEPDHTIFVKDISGEHVLRPPPPPPLATVWLHNVTRPPAHLLY